MPHPAPLVFDGLLLLAAASDVCRYRIPNGLCAALAVAGLVIAFPATGTEMASRAASFALVSGVAGALWLRGLLGGGDLKLLMACALWIPFGELARFGMILGLASGLQGLASLAWARTFAGASGTSALRRHIPYGLSIAAAGTLWSSAHFGVF